MFINIFTLIRFKDWLKNIIIFFPFIFNDNLRSQAIFFETFFVFISFSILCSIIYISNDILDVESDRKHILKKKIKPIANESISINFAYLLIIILILIFFLLIYLNSYYYHHFLAYFILMIFYNLILKKLIVIDILFLSFGYLIRVDLGSSIMNTTTSFNLFMCIFSLVSFIFFIKRYIEFQLQLNTRSSLKYYNKYYLKILIYLCGLLFIISSIYFVIFENLYLIFTIPFIIYNIYMYYNISINNTSGEFPIDVVLKNRLLLINTSIILAIIIFIYF